MALSPRSARRSPPGQLSVGSANDGIGWGKPRGHHMFLRSIKTSELARRFLRLHLLERADRVILFDPCASHRQNAHLPCGRTQRLRPIIPTWMKSTKASDDLRTRPGQVIGSSPIAGS